MSTIEEILNKLNINPKNISEEILLLDIPEELNIFKEYDFNDDFLIIKGGFDNLEVKLEFNFNDNWNYITYIHKIINNYTSLKIYNNNGFLHTRS